MLRSLLLCDIRVIIAAMKSTESQPRHRVEAER
jgi:hypothetical protein